MDEDAVSDDKTDTSVADVEEDNVQEAVSPDGEILRELRGAGEFLTRVELDLAYSSEKLLNLDIFLMHVVDRENDYETLAMENEEISDDSIQKALEFNFLSGILDSEVRELEKLMDSLQPEIVDVREKISSCGHFRENFHELERKLHDSEESLEQSQNQVAEIRMQCDKFQRTLLAICGEDNWDDSKDGDVSDNDHFSNRNAKIKMQTAEQQRHILRMLEKSLARELDLEKKLSDSRNGEDELNQKLHSAEQEMFCMDEAVEDVFWRLFEAENAAEVLMGISKEMMGRLQIVQFNLNGSILREGEMKSKLQDLMKPSETKGSGLRMLETGCETPENLVETKLDNIKSNLQEDGRDTHISSEAISLREKVESLELQLKECESQLQSAKDSVVENQKQRSVLTSQLSEMNNIIEDLNENMSKAESRAETAETKCSLLAETNLVLTEELGLIKSSDIGMEKVSSLEKQLRESDNQLQHAKASVEASQEQQNMLYSAIADMENLINDLKSKVLKAESRAEKSDTKCAILSETNLELNEEVSFLRSRMECLETSLCQADEEKSATAKEINKRAKVITDLVMQLALERERLHKQMSLLTKENKILVANFRKGCEDNRDQEIFGNVDMACDIGTKEPEETITEFSTTTFQVNKSEKDAPAGETEVEPTVSAEDAALGATNLASVGRIERRNLSRTYFLIPIVVLLVSAIAVYLFHPDRYPL
ncbi:hypothetical protein AQUCO_00600367v1 [Aquilegia coerulea]|uniref:WIT1/2 N-terminal helical bundle domain-containing protein n=1 Tax=Aquilegia coerulea TaxID=218851 RepID=A0A2G5EPR0_AQUCA|nr:hypothetical protein AQUCO_00600367v1 [Aquilegia coerulea]